MRFENSETPLAEHCDCRHASQSLRELIRTRHDSLVCVVLSGSVCDGDDGHLAFLSNNKIRKFRTLRALAEGSLGVKPHRPSRSDLLPENLPDEAWGHRSPVDLTGGVTCPTIEVDPSNRRPFAGQRNELRA
jgi:hypothetical protein